MKSVHL